MLQSHSELHQSTVATLWPFHPVRYAVLVCIHSSLTTGNLTSLVKYSFRFIKYVSMWYIVVCLHRYLRGTEERGIILGAIDEITQSLEDNAMNLQSMAASRFVAPFFDRVQKWEKSLSHISEVVEVSKIALPTYLH